MSAVRPMVHGPRLNISRVIRFTEAGVDFRGGDVYAKTEASQSASSLHAARQVQRHSNSLEGLPDDETARFEIPGLSARQVNLFLRIEADVFSYVQLIRVEGHAGHGLAALDREQRIQSQVDRLRLHVVIIEWSDHQMATGDGFK